MLAFQAFHLAAYHFAQGTFQPPANGSALGCPQLDILLSGGGDSGSVDLNSALDMCFDPKFSCSHAEPFVGMGEILATSADNEKQASIRMEGSDTWYPALVPMHAPRGSRIPSNALVPVVGCLVDNNRTFVLSWADMRCRSISTVDAYSFPAECDGGNQRNVMIEDTAAGISFVESLKQEERRKLLGDTDNTFIKGKKTAILVLISPSDAATAAEPWSDIAANHGSPKAFVDAVMATVNTTLYGWSWGEAEFNWTTVGPYKTTSEYTASNCGVYNIGSSSGDKNILGAAAAAVHAVDVIAQRFDSHSLSPSLT